MEVRKACQRTNDLKRKTRSEQDASPTNMPGLKGWSMMPWDHWGKPCVLRSKHFLTCGVLDRESKEIKCLREDRVVATSIPRWSASEQGTI